MKPKNTHLQYHPGDDRVMLVDHTRKPFVAFDLHEEFLFCVGAWGLRGNHRGRKLNIVEKALKALGFRVAQARATRVVESASGTLRVTVEHLTRVSPPPATPWS